MKRVLAMLLLGALPILACAQIKDPVKWTFSAKKLAADKYEIHMTAAIGTGWHLYSQTTPDGGPIPTSINFSKNPLVTLEGKAKEMGKMEKKNEPLFGVDVHQFSTKVDFVQVVKVKPGIKTTVNGTVEYMVCDDKECLPPTTKAFSLSLN